MQFDVVIVSKFQIASPNLGVSKAYDQMIQSINNLGLTVCLLTEGKLYSSKNLSPLLTIVTIPAGRKSIKTVFEMGIPHPISFWLAEARKYLGLGTFVIAPIVGMQTSIFASPKSQGQKFIATLHTPYSRTTPLGFIYHRIQKRSLKYSDIDIANSKTIVEKLKLENIKKVNVIPHAADVQKVLLAKQDSLKIDPIWIGTFTHRKGVDRLARFVLLNRRFSNVRIVWSKSKFDYVWYFIFNSFSKMGWCELHSNLTETELIQMLLNSSCLISTTRFESFGLTLVEAAGTGTGIVGMSAPGVIETLPESSGGSIYFSNVKDLSRYFRESTSQKKIEILGINAAEYIGKVYSFERVSMLWSKVLDM